MFAFALINRTTHTLEIKGKNDHDLYRRINALKIVNPKLKTQLSVGGWGQDLKDSPFSKMVASKEKRAIFIKSSIDTLRNFGFDGLDLD